MAESQEHHNLLKTVNRLGACLGKTWDLDHFLEVAVKEVVASLDIDAVGVLLYDDTIDDFYWRILHDPLRYFKLQEPDMMVVHDRSSARQALATAAPIITNAQKSNEVLADCTDRQEKEQHPSKLFAPLLASNSCDGLLVLAKSKNKNFGQTEIETILGIAGIIGLCIDRDAYLKEVLVSYRKAAGLERIKAKIINRLSHELRTPLAIIKASLNHLSERLAQMGIRDFDPALSRINRQVDNLAYLEMQVSSILTTGTYEERNILSGLLESAASLIELQSEQKPEIRSDAVLILRILEEAFPEKDSRVRLTDMREFANRLLVEVKDQVTVRGRRVALAVDLMPKGKIRIPDLVLYSTIEGIIRNAIEATPDNGVVEVRGRMDGDFYVLTVKDSGIGIPQEDWGFLFEGFYQVQETEDYTTGRRYSFNAGGKGIDLFRIKMFSKVYGFGVYFQSRRCRHLTESLQQCPGDVYICPSCRSLEDCIASGGTLFELDFPCAK